MILIKAPEILSLSNKSIAKFMGYLYYHNGIDVEGDWGSYTRRKVFSKVPILSYDNEKSDQYEFAEVPNPDYNKPKGERCKWNRDYETISWSTVNYDQYEYDLKYYESWGLLMGVIEKIESIGHKTIIGGGDHWGNYCNIIYSTPNEPISMLDSLDTKALGQGKTKLEAVYNAVTEFIEWYNLKNNEDGSN